VTATAAADAAPATVTGPAAETFASFGDETAAARRKLRQLLAADETDQLMRAAETKRMPATMSV
jgi:hypothetical protein